MGLNSTHYLSYREIKLKDTDLIEDAFGFEYDFNDVITALRKLKSEPGETLTNRLIIKLKGLNQ